MRPVGNEYLEQYNALLRYVFQVTDQELSSVGWQEKEIIRAKFQIFFIHQESPNSPFHTKYIHRYSIGEVQIKGKPPRGPTQSQLSQSRITPQQDSAARNPEAAALLGLSTVAILIEPKRPEPLPQSAGRIIAFPPGQALQDGRFDLIPIFHPQKKQD